MRAIGIYEFGGPESLQVIELADPVPTAGEVLIRVHAATVNPTDVLRRSGANAALMRADSDPPYVLGMEAAGVLEAVGPEVVTDLAPGDPVMAIVVPRGAHGAYAEMISVPIASVAKAPAGFSMAQAATLPMNGLTARLALDVLSLPRGGTLAVTGAAGALGGYIIQLAKADGLTVIADAQPTDEELVGEMGADIIVARGAEMADLIRQKVPAGVDGLVDAALLGEKVIPALRDGGKVITVRGYRGPSVPERGITFQPIMVRDSAHEHEKLDQLRRQAEAGQITLRVAKTFRAADAAQAHRMLEAGGVRGRLVIEF